MNAKSQQQLRALLEARSVTQVEAILSTYPIVDPEAFQLDHDGKAVGKWRDGHLHWLPVGRDRGNGGRIKLAGHPTNPIAERLINGMEAVIELERLRELAQDKESPMPDSPRDAVMRYFGLPRLDSIPQMDEPTERRKLLNVVDQVRLKLCIRLAYDKQSKQFSVVVCDEGTGQRPARIHRTLLSLGQTDKADKPYMIGVFGQGGSSAFATSEYSVIISRRAPDLVAEGDGGIGWSIVRQVFPKGRRDPYFAYLAASPDGSVPRFDGAIADSIGFKHGSHFCHIKYDFGGSGSAVARALYQALNHVLFNPIMPYDLFTIDKERPELMQGTAQRLARQTALLGPQKSLDKSFANQPVGNVA
jgi:hypothetical protein